MISFTALTGRSLVVALAILLTGLAVIAWGTAPEDSSTADARIDFCAVSLPEKPPVAAREQRKIPVLVRAARSRLGRAKYGGVWVDRQSRRIKLGVAAQCAGVSPGVLKRASRSIEHAELEGRVDVVFVDRPEKALLRLQRSLDRQLERINRRAAASISAAPNVQANTVNLEVPSRRHTTSRQETFVDRARHRYGSRVRIVRGGGPLVREVHVGQP